MKREKEEWREKMRKARRKGNEVNKGRRIN